MTTRLVLRLCGLLNQAEMLLAMLTTRSFMKAVNPALPSVECVISGTEHDPAVVRHLQLETIPKCRGHMQLHLPLPPPAEVAESKNGANSLLPAAPQTYFSSLNTVSIFCCFHGEMGNF